MSETPSGVREPTFGRACRAQPVQALNVAFNYCIVDIRDLDLPFQKPSSKMVGSPQMESNASFRIAAPIKGTGNVGEVRAKKAAPQPRQGRRLRKEFLVRQKNLWVSSGSGSLPSV